jgi:hypothetical protein
MIVIESLEHEIWNRTLKNPIRKFTRLLEDFSKKDLKLWQQIGATLDLEFIANMRLGVCEYCGNVTTPRRNFDDTVICRVCEHQHLMILELEGKKDARRYLEGKLGLQRGYRFVSHLEEKGVMTTMIEGVGEVDVTALIEHPGIRNLQKLSSVVLYGVVIHPHLNAKEREPVLIVGGTVKDTAALLIGIGFGD